jgi:hypothetical protein
VWEPEFIALGSFPQGAGGILSPAAVYDHSIGALVTLQRCRILQSSSVSVAQRMLELAKKYTTAQVEDLDYYIAAFR